MSERSDVAMSPDRQWLVVRVPQVGMLRAFGFEILRRVQTEETNGYLYLDWVLGTGQSADDVLTNLLNGVSDAN